MDLSLLAGNLLNAPVLFFLLGVAARWLRSDLEIPNPIPRLLSLYLLMAIGFRGGTELAEGGLDGHVLRTLGACILAAALTPLWCYWLARRRLSAYDAAAVAATYGSISAVTFITAISFLDSRSIPHSGFMVAAMALMESPAIVVAIVLVRLFAPAQPSASHEPESIARHGRGWRSVLHEAFLNGAVLLLLGSLIIGMLTHADAESLNPLLKDPFKGVLCLFLLDMGLVAARRLDELRRAGVFLAAFAVAMPVVHAMLGIGLARLLNLAPGDALLLAVLCGSASYIAVPAAVRMSIPQANPGVFVPMSLAITFPFNVIVGIPLYMAVIEKLWSAA